jgi:hypothetical protein
MDSEPHADEDVRRDRDQTEKAGGLECSRWPFGDDVLGSPGLGHILASLERAT